MSVYVALGGAPAIRRLADAWHARCLADEVVAHAFSHPNQHPEHLARLAAYWGEALGGPRAYSEAMGDHSHVVALHSGHGEHADMDRRGERCFAAALEDARIPAELHAPLNAWFAAMNAEMAAYPRAADDVPAGLAIPVLQSD